MDSNVLLNLPPSQSRETIGGIPSTSKKTVAITAVMSFGILLIRLGWQDNFLKIWFGDFLIGCCLSIPTGFTIVPLIKKLVDSLTDKDKNGCQQR
jgi:hypothetical protein